MSADLKLEDVFGDLPVLQTERLRLRRLRLDDAAAVFAYASDSGGLAVYDLGCAQAQKEWKA